jgi:nitrogen regulatory protein P-II 1
MKRIEAIIRPVRLEALKTALAEAGVSGVTVSDVRGTSRSGDGTAGSYRGQEYVMHLPAKIKIEMVVPDADVDTVIDTILEQARTGQEGDGKIFVLPAGDAVKIRTGETGESVL